LRTRAALLLVILGACRPVVADAEVAQARVFVDRDVDGVLLSADLCPDDPEVWNGYEGGDGCPDDFIGMGNPAHCESLLLQPIGGLIGPPSVACANASTPLLLRTIDDPSNPEELHRLLKLAGESDHPLRSFEPLLIRVHDRSGALAKGASVFRVGDIVAKGGGPPTRSGLKPPAVAGVWM